MLCTENTLVKIEPHRLTAAPMRCKRWTCEICAPMNTKELKRKARRGAPTTFLTLTVNPNSYEGPHERAEALKGAWRKVVRRIKKQYGYAQLPYLCVFERTKAGEPHLHIMCRVRWIGQQWLSDQMRREIDAPIVDVRRIRSARRAAAYVAKYVAKAPEKWQGCKRWWRAKCYDIPQDGDDPEPGSQVHEWLIRHMRAEMLVQLWAMDGWRIEHAGFSYVMRPPLGGAREPPPPGSAPP